MRRRHFSSRRNGRQAEAAATLARRLLAPIDLRVYVAARSDLESACYATLRRVVRQSRRQAARDDLTEVCASNTNSTLLEPTQRGCAEEAGVSPSRALRLEIRRQLDEVPVRVAEVERRDPPAGACPCDRSILDRDTAGAKPSSDRAGIGVSNEAKVG